METDIETRIDDTDFLQRLPAEEAEAQLCSLGERYSCCITTKLED